MRFKEILPELFDEKKARPYTWFSGGHIANALLADGRSLTVGFPRTVEDNRNMYSIEFGVDGDFDVTGGGDANTIFATVIAIVKDFIKRKRSVKSLVFTAEEKSRAKVYDTIAKRVAKQLGWHVVPYDEMIADKKYRTPLSYGAFLFAIEPGDAPEHRQAAQKPQHGAFNPIYYVYSFELTDAPAIKISAKNGNDAEAWVIRNVPEYKDADVMGIFAAKAPPPDRKIIDMGEVPAPKPKREMNPLEKALHQKLSTDN